MSIRFNWEILKPTLIRWYFVNEQISILLNSNHVADLTNKLLQKSVHFENMNKFEKRLLNFKLMKFHHCVKITLNQNALSSIYLQTHSWFNTILILQLNAEF